jgi:hypothetical protein
VRQERDEGEQAEQRGRRAGDGRRRPLPLGLNAQVRAAAIAQTTWLLAQRALTQAGLLGVDMAKVGGSEARRTPRAEAAAKPTLLCPEAIAALQEYKCVGVAG